MGGELPVLGPPESRSGYSVARLTNYWYIACPSADLASGPRAIRILGTPLVLFRNRAGTPGALLDRCPHRNVPLSFGTRAGDHLQCGYHGWEFDVTGACRAVPGLCGEAEAKGRRAVSYPTLERDGFVWVFMNPESEPVGEPYRPPHVDDPKYTTVRRHVQAASSLFLTIENALDVPHTAFLHGGLFRTAEKKHEIEAIVRMFGDRCEAEYLGEPRPPGLAARLLSPSGGVVTHYDRFLLPSISQVEYRLGDENHLLITSIMTPETDFHTHLYAVVSFRTRIPGWLVRPVVQPIAERIFDQDAKILELQTANLKEFGGEHFVSTEIDVLGLHIWKLMKQAENGGIANGSDVLAEHRIRLRV